MKQKRSSLSKHKAIKIIVGVIIGIFLIAQISFDVFIYRTFGDDLLISTIIIRAEEDLNKPAVVEPISGDVYITDARLKLPPPSDSFMSVVYRYSPGSEYQEKEVSISENQMIHGIGSKIISVSQAPSGGHNIKEVFDQIPKLQACGRGVRIYYKPYKDANSKLKLELTKTLQNGQQIYIYSETRCNNSLFPEVIEYVKQIQSY